MERRRRGLPVVSAGDKLRQRFRTVSVFGPGEAGRRGILGVEAWIGDYVACLPSFHAFGCSLDQLYLYEIYG